MQQLKIAERPHTPNAEVMRSFIQRLIAWGAENSPPKLSNVDRFDDCDLDQRVRQSGEW